MVKNIFEKTFRNVNNKIKLKLRNFIFTYFLGLDFDETKLNILSLIDCESNPNISDLWWKFKDIDLMRLNIKNFGYELGLQLGDRLANYPIPEHPAIYNLTSKPTTQADIESPWFRYWCHQIGSAPLYHRKLWEFAFALQILSEHGILISGKKGIGFGCGEEPLASYFASKGMEVTITDLDPDRSKGLGWIETGQHTSVLDTAWRSHLVNRQDFDTNVGMEFVDMNQIPNKFNEQYDFCWSICALEHLGSIEKGLQFIENSLNTLKPGGIAVHTTEFNYLNHKQTIDNWGTVLFQERHFLDLAQRLAHNGHKMLEPDFNIGDKVLDRFIDLPPYTVEESGYRPESWYESKDIAHLKLAIDGFACTCYGIAIVKAK
jgi:2-polyprenyl-3-methyl-5-hydroxy-6-metoxy-1,4-benzoquinol methylase